MQPTVLEASGIRLQESGCMHEQASTMAHGASNQSSLDLHMQGMEQHGWLRQTSVQQQEQLGTTFSLKLHSPVVVIHLGTKPCVNRASLWEPCCLPSLHLRRARRCSRSMEPGQFAAALAVRWTTLRLVSISCIANRSSYRATFMLMRVRSVTAIHISKSGDRVDVHLHDAGLSAALAGSSSLLHLLCTQFCP